MLSNATDDCRDAAVLKKVAIKRMAMGYRVRRKV
jgi:hypothetical protein